MLGYEPQHDASALRIHEHYPEWAAKLVRGTGIPHAIEHGSWAGETAFLRTDGREVPISQVILAHRGAGGSVEFLSTVARDVSMKRQLEQAQRINSLGRAAATIAHEFNNVLMGIQPFAEIIRRRSGDDERIAKAAEQISNSVRRGKRVTDEILRFTNAVAPVLQIINMGEWLTLIEPELHAVAGSKVKRTVVLPPESVFAPCDSAQMQQVITNLVINARDAMPAGGAVSLTLATSAREDSLFTGLSEHERFVHLTVRDAGSGIDPEILEQIFEPLFTTKRSGTGLGLAVARQVLTQHAGFIFAENVRGGGTAFHIFLPQADEGVRTAVAVRKTSGRIRRLLLVEDEASVAAGLSSLLELQKIVVRVVEQGREVVRAIEEFAPDAVVLDLTLPDIDGREVFAQITARWPHLPVVFSTGHSGEADLAQELSRDHVGFLLKPYEVSALMAAIEKVL
jgi:signal transduction histidine kinase/CheY-like chemotaxis protein